MLWEQRCQMGFVSCVSGRSLCITWEITVTDGRGRRSTFEQSHAFFSSTAVFVFWGAVSWPSFNQLTSLELCGVSRVPLHCPAPYRCGRCQKYKDTPFFLSNLSEWCSCFNLVSFRPGWKSVMSKIKLQGEHSELCVADKIVKMLYVGQGVTLGFWQVFSNSRIEYIVEQTYILSSGCQSNVFFCSGISFFALFICLDILDDLFIKLLIYELIKRDRLKSF